MGVCNRQPLAKSKGVHREVESEGSWRQSSGPRNTNIIRQKSLGEFAIHNKAPRLHGSGTVNNAGRWNESLLSYRGRSHRRVETEVRNAVETRFAVRSQPKP